MKCDRAKVLVVIPTHNRARILPEAIESVLSQDYPTKRIVVVDDGSEDGTAALCREYIERGFIEYVSKSNGGCASARNMGLQHIDSSIEYVCFLDSDDRQLPSFLNRAVALLEATPEADFCYADSVIYDEDTGRERLQRIAAAGDPGRFAIQHFLTNEAKAGSILYREETVRRRRFREDLRYNEDSEFLQRIAIECHGFYLPHAGSWVRWHQGSKSRNTLEINRAVLRASRDILAAYPSFYTANRTLADQRIRDLEKALFASLALAGQWTEAECLAKTVIERISLATRIKAYYRIRQLARWLVRRIAG